MLHQPETNFPHCHYKSCSADSRGFKLVLSWINDIRSWINTLLSEGKSQVLQEIPREWFLHESLKWRSLDVKITPFSTTYLQRTLQPWSWILIPRFVLFAFLIWFRDRYIVQLLLHCISLFAQIISKLSCLNFAICKRGLR